MIKTEKVPVAWREEKRLYCDNCKKPMAFVSVYSNGLDSQSWKYKCNYCGLKITSPMKLEGPDV